MRMYRPLGFLGAIAFAYLFTLSFSGAAYSQTSDKRIAERQAKINAALNDPGYQHFNCDGADAECLISETPVPGVRMVRPKDYPIRPAPTCLLTCTRRLPRAGRLA